MRVNLLKYAEYDRAYEYTCSVQTCSRTISPSHEDIAGTVSNHVASAGRLTDSKVPINIIVASRVL